MWCWAGISNFFHSLTVLHMYRVIIISDSDGLLPPIGLFIVLTYLTNLTAQRTPELPREVTNCSSQVKHDLFISIGFSARL